MEEQEDVVEFNLPLASLSEELVASLTDELAPIINKKTPDGWLQKAGDYVTYDLKVRIAHGSDR